MSKEVRPFSQPTLVALVGVSNITFTTWRRRNGLFPWTYEDRKWNSYTYREVVAAALVVELTRMSISAQAAVDIAMAVLPKITRLSDKPKIDDRFRFLVLIPAKKGVYDLAFRSTDDALRSVLDDTGPYPSAIVVDIFRLQVDVSLRFEKLAAVRKETSDGKR